MGHFLQAEGLSEVGEIHQKLHDAPVVGLEELPEGQDGEKLGLGEVPAGKPLVSLSCCSIMSAPLPHFQDLFNRASLFQKESSLNPEVGPNKWGAIGLGQMTPIGALDVDIRVWEAVEPGTSIEDYLRLKGTTYERITRRDPETGKRRPDEQIAATIALLDLLLWERKGGHSRSIEEIWTQRRWISLCRQHPKVCRLY